MPREEDLPTSKGGKIAEEKTNENIRFRNFIGVDLNFSKLSDEKKINWAITYMNDSHARYNLIIEALKEKIKVLEDGLL